MKIGYINVKNKEINDETDNNLTSHKIFDLSICFPFINSSN